MPPAPELMPPQTKVPLYRGHIDKKKAQAMEQANVRKNYLARPGLIRNTDFSASSLDKLEPEFVSDVKILSKDNSEGHFCFD